jgi:hypothetical protein
MRVIPSRADGGGPPKRAAKNAKNAFAIHEEHAFEDAFFSFV